MNVAIIDGDVPYPANSGKRLRTLNLMLPLARRHRLTYIGRAADPGEARQAEEFLADHGIAARILDDPLPAKQGPCFYARLLGNLFSRLPYSVASHASRRVRRAAARHAASGPGGVDVWQLEFSGYLYAARGLPGRTVVQAHNVESLLWQRFYQAERHPLRRWYIRRQWRKYERFERQAFRAADRVVAVSPEDAELARTRFGVAHVDVVANGVDVGYFRGVRPAADSRTILFLGALDWRPNLDAVALLLDVFPAVAARAPGARLAVVGRRPPAWLAGRLAGMPGVELHADVPDVRPYLAASAVLAVPLQIGGGSRLKILEALACGLPVVSTRVGAEGLAVRPGEDYVLAETREEMTEALAGCLLDPGRARRLAGQGQKTVTARYDWPMLADRLERVWFEAAGGR
jgi:glycosyltransferase involved in cell wall biosynthesis